MEVLDAVRCCSLVDLTWKYRSDSYRAVSITCKGDEGLDEREGIDPVKKIVGVDHLSRNVQDNTAPRVRVAVSILESALEDQ